jgi:hypothetical protein
MFVFRSVVVPTTGLCRQTRASMGSGKKGPERGIIQHTDTSYHIISCELYCTLGVRAAKKVHPPDDNRRRAAGASSLSLQTLQKRSMPMDGVIG